MTWPDLVADLETYKEDHGAYPGLLILDSADDIAPFGKSQKVYEQLREAYTFLRLNIAQAKGMRVWTSGQLNRDSVEKGRVSLRHIGDAFAKAQKAHYCLGFAQTQQEREHLDGPKMNVYVLKDSLWGTSGGWLEVSVSFGYGSDGFPGFHIENVHGLPT